MCSCYAVRNFLLWKKGEKHTKNLPPEMKRKGRKKSPDHTKRGNSDFLAHGLIIRDLTVIKLPAVSLRETPLEIIIL